MVGETVVAGKLPIRIERFGRPEIKNVIMSMKEYDQVNRDLEIRDLYNLEDAFHMSKDYRERTRAPRRQPHRDRSPGRDDGLAARPDGAHPLTELLLDDYLVVDVAKPFAEDEGLEIERALLVGRPHETCGGRSLNNRTMHAIYTLLVNADKGPRIGDGVDQATVPRPTSSPTWRRPIRCRLGGLPIGNLIARVRQQAVAHAEAR